MASRATIAASTNNTSDGTNDPRVGRQALLPYVALNTASASHFLKLSLTLMTAMIPTVSK